MNDTRSFRGASHGFGIVLVSGALVCLVAQQANGAEASTSSFDLAEYARDIRLAQQSLDGGNRERAQSLLNKYLPRASDKDIRGFEWRYLWRLCQGSSNSTATPIERKGLVERNTVSPLLFTRDSRVLVSACADTIARQFDVDTLEEVVEMAGVKDPLHLCTDGHTLVAAGYSGLQVWDLRSQVLAPIWFFPRGGDWAMSGFSPDGKWAVVRHSGGQLQFIDAIQRQELANVSAHTGTIRALVFSPDSHTLASAGTDRLVKLWDFARRTHLNSLTGHTEAVTCLAFSPDGRQLSSAGLDRTIRVWNVGLEADPNRLEGHRGTIWTIAFSPDGKTLASGSEDLSVKLWSTTLGVELVTLQTLSTGERNPGKAAVRLAFSPDGNCLAGRLFDGTLRLWRASPVADAASTIHR